LRVDDTTIEVNFNSPDQEASVPSEQQRPGGESDPAISPLELKHVLYTAEALVDGGRAGHGRTSDGRLDVELSVPAAMSGDDGPGTNPEQLFAVGYAACFQSSLLAVARGRNVDASGSQIASRVGIGARSSGGFGLQVWLDLRDPEIPAEEGRELMLRADRRCPYSNATRGNITVTLSVNGQPV
jgi:Ohr subfamily peroxiredoxin